MPLVRFPTNGNEHIYQTLADKTKDTRSQEVSLRILLGIQLILMKRDTYYLFD